LRSPYFFSVPQRHASTCFHPSPSCDTLCGLFLCCQDLFGSSPGAVFTSVKQSCMGKSFKDQLLLSAKTRPSSLASVQLGGACEDNAQSRLETSRYASSSFRRKKKKEKKRYASVQDRVSVQYYVEREPLLNALDW